jgi:hypothetical protein
VIWFITFPTKETGDGRNFLAESMDGGVFPTPLTQKYFALPTEYRPFVGKGWNTIVDGCRGGDAVGSSTGLLHLRRCLRGDVMWLVLQTG